MKKKLRTKDKIFYSIVLFLFIIACILSVRWMYLTNDKCNAVRGCDKYHCEYMSAIDEHGKLGIDTLEFNSTIPHYGEILSTQHRYYDLCMNASNISFKIYKAEYKQRNNSLFEEVSIVLGNVTHMEEQISIGYGGANCFRKGDTINIMFSNFFTDLDRKDWTREILGNETDCPDLPLENILKRANASRAQPDDVDELRYLGEMTEAYKQ